MLGNYYLKLNEAEEAHQAYVSGLERKQNHLKLMQALLQVTNDTIERTNLKTKISALQESDDRNIQRIQRRKSSLKEVFELR